MTIINSPRGQSLVAALIITLIYILGLFIPGKVTELNGIYWKAGFGVVLFIATYITTHQLFIYYVEKRLEPILKNIRSASLSKNKLRKRIDSDDFPEKLDRAVKIWASNQTNEIRQLREMERFRRDFLGNVSHELKTPIFNIQGYILTLLDGGLEDPSVNKLYLQRAEKSISRMITIVDDLVSISRLEAGEFKLKIDEFNIVKLVDEAFEQHEMLARQYKIRLEFDDSYAGIRVRADRKRITEVLSNLIVNSIKYGKPGGRTRVSFREVKDLIEIEIADNGIGIAEEHLPRIFERFYRVDKSRSRESGGTGLGLAIVKHILQAHNQAVHVKSAPGKGTSFIFSLEKA